MKTKLSLTRVSHQRSAGFCTILTTSAALLLARLIFAWGFLMAAAFKFMGMGIF